MVDFRVILKAFVDVWMCLAVDIAAIVHLGLIGLELDFATQIGPWPLILAKTAIIGVYSLELVLSLIARPPLLIDRRTVPSYLCLALSIWGAYIRGNPISAWAWRIASLRSLRLWRLKESADTSPHWRDLWFVLTGLERAVSSICFLSVLLLPIVMVIGVAARGLIVSEGGADSLTHYLGMEYFGTAPRAALSMLQVMTMDGWASAIARPILTLRPWTAMYCAGVVLVAGYGVLSIYLGIIVWCTVDTARATHMETEASLRADVKETFDLLREYYEATLLINGRSTLDRQTVKDSMAIPAVSAALRTLELPVETVDDLMIYLDPEEINALTVDEFIDGMLNLMKPPRKLDCLTLVASAGGNTTFLEALAEKSDNIATYFHETSLSMISCYNQFSALVKEDGAMGDIPECVLRKKGTIQPHMLIDDPRYTES